MNFHVCRSLKLLSCFLLGVFCVGLAQNAFADGLVERAPAQAYVAPNWLSMSYVYESNDYNRFTVKGFGLLPKGFSVWGALSLESAKFQPVRSRDLSTHFGVVNISSASWHGIGAIVEFETTNGNDNDLGRLGAYYQPSYALFRKAHLWMKLSFFALETDNKGIAVTYAWNLRMPWMLQGRVSVGGFVTAKTKQGATEETQATSRTELRVRLVGQLHFLAEYRVSEFLPSQEEGTTYGVYYKF